VRDRRSRRRSARACPYVGPRALQEGERAYGRADDCEEIIRLLNSERVALLHAPSGAGKSSLINAEIIPRLKKYFEPIRVSVGRPAAMELVSETPAEHPVFRFERLLASWNFLISQEKALATSRGSQERELPASRPSRTTLAAFSKLPESITDAIDWDDAVDDDKSHTKFPLLIIDQLEDVFASSGDEEHWDNVTRMMFKELGNLLNESDIWALFSIREDFLGQLEPWSEFFPNGLRARYRLDLLGHKQAMDAVCLPAKDFGVTFGEPEAHLLVQRLQQAIDPFTGKPKQGKYVEPVLLQVVCKDIWDRRDRSSTTIDKNLIPDEDKINDAIGRFYDEVILKACNTRLVTEAPLRDWCGNDLIKEHMRCQVNIGPVSSSSTGQLLELLEDEHLIRPDTRGGTTWYELAHDRLIEPIIGSNRRWELELPEDQRLLKRAAEAWAQHNESNAYLLRGRTLVDAQRWAAKQGNRISPIEARYLRQSELVQ
jgi:hypothetical protein